MIRPAEIKREMIDEDLKKRSVKNVQSNWELDGQGRSEGVA